MADSINFWAAVAVVGGSNLFSSGNMLMLNDLEHYIVTDDRGSDMPPVSQITEDIPGLRGLHLKQVKTGQRELELKIAVLGATATIVQQNMDALARVLEPNKDFFTEASCFIRWIRSGASAHRDLFCRYTGGLDKFSHETNPKGSLLFKAVDPYWYALAISQTWYKTSDSAYFFPFPPLKLSHAEIFQSFTIYNNGDVETWPIWTVTGPGSDLALYNLSTDLSLTLTGSIGAGEVLTIDTRPEKKVILDANGNRRNYMINAGSALWKLNTGSNVIRVEMSSADANSKIQLTYSPRYNRP